MSNSSKTIYEFGPFRIDMERYLLLRDGEPIPLSPKVFETLLFLVENRGRVGKKDEIINSVWPDTFVEESNLAQNVFLLRKALREEKNEHRYIVTIPGVGYRFVAPVREFDGPNASPEPAPARVSSIAVLPFKDLLGDDEDKFLGPGLADALIMRLSSIRELKVRPTAAVLRYSNLKEDPLQIGRELNVDALLDGVYQRETGKIRVSVQLVSVRDGVTLWAAKFDEQLTDIFAIQDSIADQVVRSLAIQLSGDEQRQIKKNYTRNPDAFQLFIKGRYFWNQRTIEGLRKALEHAQQAIAVDPAYAPAYVGLADSYSLLGAQHNVLPPRESFPKARAAASRALEIDPMLAEAYASLAFINCWFEWNWTASEQNHLKAIELKPNYPTAHHWYGELLTTMGRFEEAYVELQMAQELDPLSLAINVDLAASFYYARDFKRSERQLLNLLELNASFVRAHVILGKVYVQQGEFARGIEILQKAVELSGEDPVTLSALAHAVALIGKTPEAQKLVDDLHTTAKQRYVSAYHIAEVYLGLGNKELAYKWLDQAYENRDVELVWLKVSPVFESLRCEPRFTDLSRAVNPALL
ncbi:MAG TPA: winged helix-turn-helix domain-containing protein [Pyrinomonadaceae bacterium]|nr:winged helix-turn-helix domain-containing protein [Pyrinomonadaceae bacterium]